jgi:hypothetical protein
MHVTRVALPLLSLALLACHDQAPTLPPAIDGQWRQSGDFHDVLTGDGHIHVGSFTFRQLASGFGGEGQQTTDWCTHAATGEAYVGPLANTAPYPILDGRIVGDAVSFRSPVCQFAGRFTDERHWRMTGSAECTVVQDGTTYRYAGLWQADR